MAKLVLIVEDEKSIQDILAFNLKREGYDIAAAMDGEQGFRRAMELKPDLILLDVMLPLIDGFEVCRMIRKLGNNTPIIMLTAREEETDKVLGLELGADDYITKPFSMRELLARVKANLRRGGLEELSAPPESPALRIGELEIDSGKVEAYKNGTPLELTQREFDLLHFMAQTPDRVFSREELMEKVWNYEYYGDLRTVDVTIRRLREKLEDNAAEPRYILTRRGAGYLFAGQ